MTKKGNVLTAEQCSAGGVNAMRVRVDCPHGCGLRTTRPALARHFLKKGGCNGPETKKPKKQIPRELRVEIGRKGGRKGGVKSMAVRVDCPRCGAKMPRPNMSRHLQKCDGVSKDPKARKRRVMNLYKVIGPDGSARIIDNLSAFARENGLNQGNLSAAASNGNKVKGYSVSRVRVGKRARTFRSTYDASAAT
jgi:hypothetical protein